MEVWCLPKSLALESGVQKPPKSPNIQVLSLFLQRTNSVYVQLKDPSPTPVQVPCKVLGFSEVQTKWPQNLAWGWVRTQRATGVT